MTDDDRPVILDLPGLHWSLISEEEVWVCGASDHGPFCRLCQKLDGTLEALLTHVADGRMEWSIDQNGEFRFKMTELGKAAAGALLRRLAGE